MFALETTITTSIVVSARLGLIIDALLLHFPESRWTGRRARPILSSPRSGKMNTHTTAISPFHRSGLVFHGLAANHSQPQYPMGKAGPEMSGPVLLFMVQYLQGTWEIPLTISR